MQTFIGWVLALAIVAFVIHGFFKASRQRASTASPPPSPSPRRALEPATLPDEFDEYEIVGESHYQRELEQLCGPKGEYGVTLECAALLVAEPTNKHDKNAVRCEISGLMVGYLGRDDAKDFAQLLRRKKLPSMAVAATIRGGWKNAKGEGSYGVTIAVPADTIG